ncbi:methyl-accepting chemotaxis protein [uncultured Tateyamaria sp.]|uniref:methyl-accepting chemotaxis protein n=1 Tax=uncultured Tateyamaria sp. TaxID=455651 RepID=UPI00261EF26A|nr:methyl-accepting chemotaxis protein [uncultured Tateyamaria sp.]
MSQLSFQTTSAPETDAERFAQRRAAIDLIATTRARAIRSALFGSYMFRVNPLGPETGEKRAQWRAILNEQRDAIARSAALVQGTDPQMAVPDWVCEWIGQHGSENPKTVAAFVRMSDLTNDVALAAGGDDVRRLRDALDVHLRVGRGGFFESVTGFCDGLWAKLDATRHAEVERASAAGDAISKTLTRLEQIGKHVRLVSLNASVEAARVGDAGRGLGVIAVEFKTLAEEIQMLAINARSEIAAMTGSEDDCPIANRGENYL